MAFRYLVATPKQSTEESGSLRSAPCPAGLSKVIDSPKLLAFGGPKDDYIVLPDEGGVIMGNLFKNLPGKERIAHISSLEANHIRATRGRHLIENYWGGYIAIFRDILCSTIHILRDPSGTLPAYYHESADATFITSDIETLEQSMVRHFQIDWQFLADHLFVYDLRSERTGLENVKELLPGFRIEITNSGISTYPSWSPWDYVEPPGGSSQHSRIEELRDVAISCIHAWARSFDKILLGVSGGLDSSIIATALKDQPTSWVAMTMATSEPDGDERRYARILAEHLRIDLIEAFHNLDDVNITKSSSSHLPRPNNHAFGQSLELAHSELFEKHNVDAYFTGQGGDNVFCYMLSATPLIDHIMAKGIAIDTWSILHNICHLTGASIWDVIAMACRRTMQFRPGYTWHGDMTFLNPASVSPQHTILSHPWLVPPRGALPGKAVHISMLLRILGTLDGYSRFTHPALITPLLSQPLVELCLQIPTWQWSEGGQNRSVARDAFKSLMPRPLIERRTKGGANSFCFDVIESSRNMLREHLLGGVLAYQGILDRKVMEDVLSSANPIQSPDHLRLSLIAESEAWARERLALT